jgi:hypothetical protein
MCRSRRWSSWPVRPSADGFKWQVIVRAQTQAIFGITNLLNNVRRRLACGGATNHSFTCVISGKVFGQLVKQRISGPLPECRPRVAQNLEPHPTPPGVSGIWGSRTKTSAPRGPPWPARYKPCGRSCGHLPEVFVDAQGFCEILPPILDAPNTPRRTLQFDTVMLYCSCQQSKLMPNHRQSVLTTSTDNQCCTNMSDDSGDVRFRRGRLFFDCRS